MVPNPLCSMTSEMLQRDKKIFVTQTTAKCSSPMYVIFKKPDWENILLQREHLQGFCVPRANCEMLLQVTQFTE